ncbi:MAG: hypothetical protein KF822_06885 [Steroidobacteraceae bacterium]|nr:hypothetical protein [Steroidobacteraceae bacterium]
MTGQGEGSAGNIRCEVREHPGHVELVCVGAYYPGAQLNVAREALMAASRSGRTAALIDVRQVAGPAPTMSERYDQAVKVAQLQSSVSPRIRLALLGHEPIVHPQRFGEIVATNRGALLRVFTDEALALEWLLAKPRTP